MAERRNHHDTRDAAGEPLEPDSRYIRLHSVGAAVSGVFLGALFAGFFVFVDAISRLEAPPGTRAEARADAIVVLTGDGRRLEQGLELLEAGRARQLLISGTNAVVTSQMIARNYPRFAHLFACCIALDGKSANTRQNAAQTALWADVNGFKSLILVTSDYHMPRAHMLARAAAPQIDILAWPIASGPRGPGANRAARDFPGAARRQIFLITEYLKYTFERGRLVARDLESDIHAVWASLVAIATLAQEMPAPPGSSAAHKSAQDRVLPHRPAPGMARKATGAAHG